MAGAFETGGFADELASVASIFWAGGGVAGDTSALCADATVALQRIRDIPAHGRGTLRRENMKG